jgi:Putative zinc-finger
MKCELKLDESAELIVGYGARTLDLDAAAAFERHIQTCPACREEAALQKAVWAALDAWWALPPEPGHATRTVIH